MWGIRGVMVTGVVALISVILTTINWAADQPTPPSPPTPEWAYHWTTRPDGTSEVWRRPMEQPEKAWMSLGTFPAPVLELVPHPARPEVIFIRTADALYRSNDAGERWTPLTNLPGVPTALALGQQTPGLVYLGTLTGGAYRSEDDGRTWTRLSPELGLLPGTMLEVIALAVSPQDDEIIYTATGYWLGTTRLFFEPAGVFLSVDGGETWLPMHWAQPGEPRVTRLVPDPERPLTVQAMTDASEPRWYSFGDVALLDEWLVAERPAARAAAAKIWGLLGGTDATQRLLERLSVERDPAVGQAIVRALGPLANEEMVPTLAGALGHDDPQVRWRAATVLGFIPSPRSVAELGQTLRNDDSIARAAAAQALVQIGTPEAAAEVIPLLDAPDLTPTRHLALSILEQIGEPAVAPLEVALATDEPALRRGAAEALGWIASPRATAALAAALNDESEAVRIKAAWALGQIDTIQAKEALAAALRDPSALVRAQANAVLGKPLTPRQQPIPWPVLPEPFTPWIEWLRWAVLALTIVLVAVILLGGNGRSRPSPRH